MQRYLWLNPTNRQLWIWMLCPLFRGQRLGFWLIILTHVLNIGNITFNLKVLNPDKVIQVLAWDALKPSAVMLETILLAGRKIAAPLMTAIRLFCQAAQMIQLLLQHKQLTRLRLQTRSTVKKSAWPFTVGLDQKCLRIVSLGVLILSLSMISQHQENRSCLKRWDW